MVPGEGQEPYELGTLDPRFAADQMRKRAEEAAKMQEVRRLTEPQKPMVHCGQRMRKLQMPVQRPKKDENEPDLVTVFACDKCGHQERLSSAVVKA